MLHVAVSIVWTSSSFALSATNLQKASRSFYQIGTWIPSSVSNSPVSETSLESFSASSSPLSPLSLSDLDSFSSPLSPVPVSKCSLCSFSSSSCCCSSSSSLSSSSAASALDFSSTLKSQETQADVISFIAKKFFKYVEEAAQETREMCQTFHASGCSVCPIIFLTVPFYSDLTSVYALFYYSLNSSFPCCPVNWIWSALYHQQEYSLFEIGHSSFLLDLLQATTPPQIHPSPATPHAPRGREDLGGSGGERVDVKTTRQPEVREDGKVLYWKKRKEKEKIWKDHLSQIATTFKHCWVWNKTDLRLVKCSPSQPSDFWKECSTLKILELGQRFAERKETQQVGFPCNISFVQLASGNRDWDATLYPATLFLMPLNKNEKSLSSSPTIPLPASLPPTPRGIYGRGPYEERIHVQGIADISCLWIHQFLPIPPTQDDLGGAGGVEEGKWDESDKEIEEGDKTENEVLVVPKNNLLQLNHKYGHICHSCLPFWARTHTVKDLVTRDVGTQLIFSLLKLGLKRTVLKDGSKCFQVCHPMNKFSTLNPPIILGIQEVVREVERKTWEEPRSRDACGKEIRTLNHRILELMNEFEIHSLCYYLLYFWRSPDREKKSPLSEDIFVVSAWNPEQSFASHLCSICSALPPELSGKEDDDIFACEDAKQNLGGEGCIVMSNKDSMLGKTLGLPFVSHSKKTKSIVERCNVSTFAEAYRLSCLSKSLHFFPIEAKSNCRTAPDEIGCEANAGIGRQTLELLRETFFCFCFKYIRQKCPKIRINQFLHVFEQPKFYKILCLSDEKIWKIWETWERVNQKEVKHFCEERKQAEFLGVVFAARWISQVISHFHHEKVDILNRLQVHFQKILTDAAKANAERKKNRGKRKKIVRG